MKLPAMPQSVRVGPHTYAVVQLPARQMPVINGRRPNGCCDFDGLCISLKQSMKRSKKQEILLHEVMHAVGHPRFIDDPKVHEEDVVTEVSPRLLQVLQENPELVAYLTS